jgi:hypothetical protein
MRWANKPPYILEATNSFSTTDMAATAELAAACDIFYTRGKAVAWFNAVVAVLGLKPSDLLQKFSAWLIERMIQGGGRSIKESDFSDDDIWEMQQLFLKHLFSHKKVKRFLPLVFDLANYHHQYAEVLLAPLPETSEDSQIPSSLCNTRFRLAPSAKIVNFTYDIEELLNCGEPHISWMYDNLPQSGSQAVIYLNDGMVCTESLAAPYILLLEKIRDETGGTSMSRTGLTSDETNDFFVFALQEGILVKS